MEKIKLQNLALLILLSSLLVLLTGINVQSVQAQAEGTCALSPEEVEGQGLRVSSLGLRVSSLGLRVSSLGLRVSSLGLRVSSLEEQEIIQEMVDNVVTPAWLVDPIDFVRGGVDYNSITTHLLVVDFFGPEDEHGDNVLQTVQTLIDAVGDAQGGVPNVIIHEVDISGATFASDIAGIIGKAVEDIRETSEDEHLHFVVNMSFGLTPCEDAGGEELFDEELGETFIAPPFNLNDFMEGAPEQRPFEPVSPVLECIVVHESEEEGSKWRPWGRHKHIKKTAYFGYYNPNSYSVEIPNGSQNRFLPRPKDRGQPTVFAPGRRQAVFSVDFTYGFAKWKLGHKKEIAWRNSPICENNEPPQPSVQTFPEGYGLTDYAREQLGLKEEYVDDYYKNLFSKVNEPETGDPFANIQSLMRMYLEEAQSDPYFSFIPVASAGNFANILGQEPLLPAGYPEVVAVSAGVGDLILPNPWPLWRLSHFGDIASPGVSVPLEYEIPGDPTSPVTEISAGTSLAAPFTSVLYSMWSTYPNACDFNPVGEPPLITSVLQNRNQNNIFTGIETPLDCIKNHAPEFLLNFGGNLNENLLTTIGTVSDSDLDKIVKVAVDNTERFSVVLQEDGKTLDLIATDNLPGEVEEVIEITAWDSRGASTSISLVLTVKNAPPTATLLVNGEAYIGEITAQVNEPVLLEFVNPSDPSNVDETFVPPYTYRFECEFVDEDVSESTIVEVSEGDNSTVSSQICEYDSPGEYWATATIFDKDKEGFTEYVIVVVEASSSTKCYATTVVSYQPGRRVNGEPISSKRQMPEKALGIPQNDDSRNFVTLGFPYGEYSTDENYDVEGSDDSIDNESVPPGMIILGFDQSILNTNGPDPDVRIWETSYRDKRPGREWQDYPEAVEVYASMDGVNWGNPIGTTSDKDQAYDLGIEYANYIMLIDVTNREGFSNRADGFDVDAVEGFDCGVAG